MKIRILLALVATCSTTLLATPPEGDGPGGKMRGMLREKMLENLPPELRQRFEAARDKAMQDPQIQSLKAKSEAAVEEFRNAMREAMMKADPGLAEQLKSYMGKKMGGTPPGFANLSEADRQKLMDAREKAKTDPAVQAAEAKRRAATTPDERRAAEQEFHAAMRTALLKVDPSLAPILDQMKPPKGSPKGQQTPAGPVS